MVTFIPLDTEDTAPVMDFHFIQFVTMRLGALMLSRAVNFMHSAKAWSEIY